MKSLLSKLPSGAMKIALVAGLVAALVGVTGVVAKGGGKPLPKKVYNKREKRQNASIASSFSNLSNQMGIFSSFKNGPVTNLPTTTTTIASLAVPAGNYAVFAKFYGTDPVASPTYTCKLNAGGDFDQTLLSLGNPDQNAALQVVHAFGAPGTITLACTKSGVVSTTDSANFIRITAIRQPSLSNVSSP